MKTRILTALCLSLFAAPSALAQDAAPTTQQQPAQQTGQQTAATTSGDVRPSEARVPLAQTAVAFDVAGREALAGRLRTQSLAATPDAPVRNVRVVVENRSPVFYNYVAGWATFYGDDGVRCGEGLWKLEAFAPGEQVEVDTPGLRLTCTPATWRVVATTLLTRTGDVAKPQEQTAPPPAETGDRPANSAAPQQTTAPAAPAVPPLEINVNGRTIPIQLGNPLELTFGKERVRIVVRQAP